MQNETISNSNYDFFYFGGTDNSYAFETINEISYEVKFKTSSYLFDGYSEIHIDAFELAIQVAINLTGKNPPLDPKISHTISAIFRDFYLKNNEQVVIYICDSSDSRQEARRRKFNQWVELFKGTEFVKVDTKILDPAGPIYYNSIILRSNNPYRDQIIQSFIDLADEQQK